MKNYELLYILPASQTSDEIVKNFDDVKKHIEKFGGKMLETLLDHPFLTKTGMSKEDEPDEIKALPAVKRKLAYPIKHERFGFYCLVNFKAEGNEIEDIDEYLRLNPHILRHMITEADPMTKEKLEQLQTLFARKKAEQDKEEAEKEASKPKEEPRRLRRKEDGKPAEKTAEEETQEAEIKEKEIEKTEIPAVTAEDKAEESREEEKKPSEKSSEEKETDKESKKEEKKSGKKSKIKLEELEDKLDAILEDTIV